MDKDIPTKEKIMFPIRISNQLYNEVRNKVNDKKSSNRGYSINKYIVGLIEENINSL